MTPTTTERWRRWRLVLGPSAEPGPADQSLASLTNPLDREVDRLLDQLFSGDRTGSLAASSPHLIELLGDIRHYFPDAISRLIQREVIERIGFEGFLEDPRLLDVVVADATLLPHLISLAATLPVATRRTARELVRRVVTESLVRLRLPVEQAVYRYLARSSVRPPRRLSEIDWPRTIRANLRYFQPAYHTFIPVRRISRPARQLQRALRSITICVDLSRSMSGSTVYATIISSILASIPNLRTSLIAFDASVVDLTSQLDDPVDLLLGLNLGGGTDIRRALDYCRQLDFDRPGGIIFLISDLRDHSSEDDLLAAFQSLLTAGHRVVPILALNDDGREITPPPIATRLATLGLRSIVATPDQFPDLLAATLESLGASDFDVAG
jgi:hypothetical protein